MIIKKKQINDMFNGGFMVNRKCRFDLREAKTCVKDAQLLQV